MEKWTSEYFYGNKISDYGLEHKRVDYRTLSKAFEGVLCNNIVEVDPYIFDNEESGSFYYYEDNDGNIYTYDEAQEKIEELEKRLEEIESEELSKLDGDFSVEHQEEVDEIRSDIDALGYEHSNDVFQWYIVDNNAIDPLRMANELVLYSEKLDCYVWGVTHYGTAWDYVLTDIELDI